MNPLTGELFAPEELLGKTIPKIPEPPAVEPEKEVTLLHPATSLGTKPLPDWARDILENVSVEEKNGQTLVKLNCGQLERERYELVNGILTNIGGKWKGNKKAHLFSYDPSETILAIQTSGCLPEKNPLDFFPTPKPLIKQALQGSLVENFLHCWADQPVKYVPRILEPSAGGGRIAEVLAELYPHTRGKIDTVELNPINVRLLHGLKEQGIIGSVIQEDFLKWEPTMTDDPHRICVMNPPFSYKGNKFAYIDHINHAWAILRRGGERVQKAVSLLAFTPQGWINNQENGKIQDFRNLVFLHGSFEKVDAGAFEESGTGVATAIVHLEWLPGRENLAEKEDWQVQQIALFIENDQESNQEATKIAERIKTNPAEGKTLTDTFFRQQKEKMMREYNCGVAETPNILAAFHRYLSQDWET